MMQAVKSSNLQKPWLLSSVDGTKAEDFLVILRTESSGFHKLSLCSSYFYILFLTLGTKHEIVTIFSEVVNMKKETGKLV